jgi:glycosyltransferase involved in cell wall biosynthesis
MHTTATGTTSTPAEPLLTAALIVRDEAERLPGCLASLRGVADEVVVVDTGSTDESVAIARSYGARVGRFDWAGDFAAARNAGLEMARGRWILSVDADERVAPVSRAALEPLLAREDLAAYMVLLRPVSGFTPYRECRLFRNDPAIRFEGVIHERVFRSAVAAGGVGRCPLLIEHTGYDVASRARPSRDLPLLVRHLDSAPDDLDGWRRLAETFAALDDAAGARRAFSTALDLARSANDGPPAALAYSGFAEWLLATGEEADALIDEGLERFPEHHGLEWLRARVAASRGEHEEAIEWYERLLRVDVGRLPEAGISYRERMFDAGAHAGIAHSLFRLERYDESASAYARAAETAPGDLEIRAKGALAQARAREAVVAA